ncbi:MAG: response regulator, partial [Ferruginibacter sp.]|nr:response regulator [Chitinophagaceae bacterium]
MKRKLATYCLALLLSIVHAGAQDSPVFTPRPDQPVQLLTDYLQLTEDKNNTLTIDQVIQNERQYSFRPLGAFKELSTRSTWWLKLEMLPSFTSDSFYIGLLREGASGISQGNDKVDVWIVRNKAIIASYETGTLTPLSKRPVARPINHNLFPVTLQVNEPLTIYLSVRRTVNFDQLQFHFALQHGSMINTGASPEDRLAWFYGGVMFILFMFGLVFFAITREKAFAWFFCIAAILYLHMQLLEPENNLTRLLFPEHPVYQFHLFSILTSSFGILILQFIRSFSKTKQLLPKWDKVIVVVMIYIAALTVIKLVLLEVNPTVNLPFYFFLLGFVAKIVIACRLMLTRDLYARWNGFALLWLIVFHILGILWNNNFLPGWFPNPWAIAQIGMLIILFFALAYRFKQSAKEKAEAAKILEMDTIKSRFFANISHEFRTPLTLMLGPLKQMEADNLDATQQKKYITMMRRNGDRLLQLINQLLDLSKLEGGKMDLQVAKTDITGLLKAIASSFDSLAEQNQVNYHVHFPEENIIGYTDRDKLEKIVVNLLSNAFRFTAANGTVSFSVEQDEKRLRFTVQDNGVGMPKEQLDKIFDRFHQVAGTEGGTGIGLSLAKELLQLHKGQISVQSETGKGSSFRVSIPVTSEFYTQAEMATSSQPIITAPIVTGNGITSFNEPEEETSPDPSLPLVLIAEDNTDLQQYISDVLRNHFQVQVAGNGKTGLQKATELVPDCIISDVMMPEMDGIEFCKRLKKEPATNHIPVILLTAKAGSSSRIEGLQTGADDYLVKPFDGPELIIRIQNLIDQRKQLRERYSKQVISLQPDEIKAPSLEQEFIQAVRRIIEENIDNELFGVAELANAVHLSRSQLHRKLKALTGQAPNELVRNYRLERALQLLQQHSGTVTEVAFQTGFSSPAYFSKCFSDRYGYAP